MNRMLLTVVAVVMLVPSLLYLTIKPITVIAAERHNAQSVTTDRDTPLIRVERMWRDKARCATSVDDAVHYGILADSVRSARLGM